MILTITGPSGSGKTSLVKILKKRYGIRELVSTTTRAPRKGEKNGIDYNFVSKEVFRMIPMIESSHFGDNYYGTSESAFLEALHDDFDSVYVSIVDRNGKEAFGAYPDVFSVYIQIEPWFAEANLIHRDGKKKAAARIKIDAKEGLFSSEGFDCIIQNDVRTSLDSLAYQFMNFVESRLAIHHLEDKGKVI